MNRQQALSRQNRRRQQSAKRNVRRQLSGFEVLECRRVLATYVVDTTNDILGDDCTDFQCSLRSALFAAAASDEADRIEIPAGNYVLDPTRGSLLYESDSDLVIAGLGASMTDVVIDGDLQSRILRLRPGGVSAAPMPGGPSPAPGEGSAVVTIENLTLQQGQSPTFDDAGHMIAASTVRLTLSNVLVQNSSSASGSAINFTGEGSLTILDSVLRENLNGSGQLINVDTTFNPGGSLTIDRTRIESNESDLLIQTDEWDVNITDTTIGQNTGRIAVLGNSESFDGGSFRPTVQIFSSTFHDNTYGGNAGSGGIDLNDVDLTIENVTLSANESYGGALQFSESQYGGVASGIIRSSTITGNQNTAGGPDGITGSASSVTVDSSILDGNCEQDVPPTSLGNNLGSATCGLVEPGDLVDVDPMLAALADNGGPVPTHALLPGSQAIDAGSTSSPLFDARGVMRPQDGDGDSFADPDIGAYEREVPTPDLTLTIADTTVDEFSGTLTLVLTLDNAAAGPFTIDVATVDGSAVGGDDFTANSETISFDGTAGETQSFVVEMFDDSVVELTETFSIELSNPSDPSINAADSATITITDNDIVTPFISQEFANESDGTVQFEVTLDKGVQDGFTIDVVVGDETATSPGDFVGGTIPISFSGVPGETQTFSVSLTDDDVSEDQETAILTLANPSRTGVATTDQAVLTIVDDDSATLSVADVQVAESAGTASIGVSLNIAVDTAFTVVASIDDSGFTADPQTLSFSGTPGEVQFIDVAIPDNAIVEPNLNLSIVLSEVSVDRVDITDSGTLTIIDDDTARLTIEDVTVSEDDGVAVFEVSLDNAVEDGFSFDVTTVDGTAVAGSDFVAIDSTIRFDGMAGEVQTITVTLIDDATEEPTEMAEIYLSGGTNDRVGGTGDFYEATFTIVDDDLSAMTPQLTLTGSTVNEEDGFATVSATLNVDVHGAFTVEVLALDYTAVNMDDFTGNSFLMTFTGTAGEVQTIQIPIVDDTTVEPTETFDVWFGDISDLSVDVSSTSVVRILDTDRATLTIADVTVNEDDGVAVFEVSLDNAVQDGFTFDVTTVDGTAVAGSDFVAIDSTIRFDGMAGEVQTITVTLIDDAINEPTEMAEIYLSGGSNDRVGDAGNSYEATFTIIDDDDEVVPTVSIQGNVSCDRNFDGILGTDETIAGVLVFLDENGNRRFDSGESATTTDATGNYQLIDVANGDAVVVAQVPNVCNTIPTNPGLTRTLIDVGELARSITASDVDGDGDQDLLVVSDLDQALRVLTNDDSEFVVNPPIDLASRPFDVATWRGFSSSLPTVAIATIGSTGEAGTLLSGQINSLQSSASGDGAIDVAIDDFDRDGEADFVTASFRSSDLNFRRSGQTGGLGQTGGTVIATGRLVRGVTSGDLNGDGLADIALVGSGYDSDSTGQVGVLLGDGDGGFSSPVFTNSARDFVEVKIVTLGSGQPTTLLALSHSGDLVTLDSSLNELSRSSVQPSALAFEVGDFNRDGLVDVAIASQAAEIVQLMVGDGNGQFVEITRAENVTAPSDLVVTDIDGDGFAEVAVTNLYRNTALSGEPAVYTLPSTVTILRLDVAEQLVQVTSEAVASVDFVFPSADAEIRLDVSNDGVVTAFDALRVVNRIQRSAAPEPEYEQQLIVDAVIREATDVNGDGVTSAHDALLIINHLARQASAPRSDLPEREFAFTLPDANDDDEHSLHRAIDEVFYQSIKTKKA